MTKEPRISNGHRTVLINGVEKADSHVQKNDTRLLSHIIPKWIKDLNIRPETIKLLEESIVNKLLDMSLDNVFLGFNNKSKGNKSKNKQLGLFQIKKLLHRKWNHQQNKKANYEGQKIFANHIRDSI